MRRKEKDSRLSWDEYFIQIAQMVSERSTCLRRKVGAILVKDKRILATGYNGAPTGLKHCAETGCLRERLGLKPGERIELCRGLHGEQNALLQAAAFGIDVSGATLYSTHQPCITCVKMLINARIKRICFLEPYYDQLANKFLREAKIKVEKIEIKKKRREDGS
ncbi:MAG: dCMP deaminase family protein [candidate division WOR-3 bacterium]